MGRRSIEPGRANGATVEVLRELVDESGLSGRELSRRTDISSNRFAVIMRGERPMLVDELAAICEALDEPLPQVVRRVEALLAGDLDATEPTLAPVTPLRPATTPSTPSPPALDKAAARTIHHRPQWESTRQWDNIGEESQDTGDEA